MPKKSKTKTNRPARRRAKRLANKQQAARTRQKLARDRGSSSKTLMRHSSFPVHDLFFKDTITALPGCLLVIMQLALSKLEYSWFEWSKVKFKKETFVDTQGRELRADIVCEAPLKASMRRKLEPLLRKKIKNFKFIFLIEHKAQNAMLVCKQLTQMLLPLSADENSLVLPIVVYHGKEPWTAPRSLHELLEKTNPLFQTSEFRKAFAKNVPNFEYRLLDLNKMSKRELAAKGLTYEVFPYTLKTIWEFETDTQRVLGRVLSKAEKLSYKGHDAFLKRALQYFCGKYPDLITMEVVVKVAVRVKAKKTAKKAKTLADYAAQRKFEIGIEQGMEKGIEKGIEQGIEKGMEKGIEQGMEKGIEQGIEQGMEKGIEKGIEQGIEKLLQRMLKRTDIKQVAKLTGLSVRRIQKLKKAS